MAGDDWEDIVRRYDAKVMSCLEKIQGSKMDEVSEGMSVLPVAMGGRGVESLALTASATFIAKQLQIFFGTSASRRWAERFLRRTDGVSASRTTIRGWMWGNV
jgi:hypothetical protein